MGHFYLFLVIFVQRRFFPKKSSSVTHNLTLVLDTMLSFKKTNGPNPRKLPDRRRNKTTDRRMERRKDGPTQIHRTLPTTTVYPVNEILITFSSSVVGENFAVSSIIFLHATDNLIQKTEKLG